jgi:hypothetical protein
LNDHDETLLPIFPPLKPPGQSSLRGFNPPKDDWAIDWARFIDIENRPNGVTLDDNGKVNGKTPTAQQLTDNKKRLQLAYRIDTSIVNPLGHLPTDIADQFFPSLAVRNLLRGWRLRLPSGQAVARAMGALVLDDDDILIGQFTDKPDKLTKITEISTAFEGNCPLWTYCLAETKTHTVGGHAGVKSHQLGEVGGRIVAETFAGLLTEDSQSFFGQDPQWKPTIGDGKTFGLKEFVKFAIGK